MKDAAQRKPKGPKITGTKPKANSVPKMGAAQPSARILRAVKRQLPKKETTSDGSTIMPLPSPQAECSKTVN